MNSRRDGLITRLYVLDAKRMRNVIVTEAFVGGESGLPMSPEALKANSTGTVISRG